MKAKKSTLEETKSEEVVLEPRDEVSEVEVETPEVEEAPEEVTPEPEVVADVREEDDCLDCTDGLRDNGTVCTTCGGTGKKD